MKIIGKILNKVDFSELKLKKKKINPKKEEKPSLLSDIVNSPEKYKLEMYIDGEELVVKIKEKGA